MCKTSSATELITFFQQQFQVIQRREDGSVNFNRGILDYSRGFGNVNSEHWLGLDNIHLLTAQAHYELRIDLQDWDDNVETLFYERFRVGDVGTQYKLIIGRCTGEAGWYIVISLHTYARCILEIASVSGRSFDVIL